MAAQLSFFDRVKALHLSMPATWSGTTKHVVTVLFTFASSADGGGICASIGTIARHAGEPERTIERVLRELRACGFLVDEGFRVFRGPSGQPVRVKSRRLMLAAMRRPTAGDSGFEPATGDGLNGGGETAVDDGFDASETVTHGGLEWHDQSVEPAILCTAHPVEPAISCTKNGFEPATGGTQTKSINRERREEPRDIGPTRSTSSDSLFLPSEPEAKPLARGRRSKPRSSISPDWSPAPAGIAYAANAGIPDADLARQISKFVNHHTAKGSLMADWAAAWRTWCDNFSSYDPSARGDGKTRANRTSPRNGSGLMGAVMRRYGHAEDPNDA